MKFGKQLETISRIGMASKGVLYIFIGFLTVLAAINLGGILSDEKAVFNFIENQFLGSAFLIVLALGLLSYFVWRTIQVFLNPENDVYYDRIANGSSGFFYGIIGVSALLQSIDLISGNSGTQKKIIAIILEKPWGMYALGIIIVGMLIRALGQFFLLYNKRFYNRINNSKLSKKGKSIIIKVGTIGYLARGAVFSIITYLYIKAMLNKSASEVGGMQKAFQLLNDSIISKAILIVIALGFVSYGIYMTLKSKYRVIPSLK